MNGDAEQSTSLLRDAWDDFIAALQEARELEARGFRVAEPGERVTL